MIKTESNYEMGPRKSFNRKDFLEQHTDWFRGFRLATREDVKPDAELYMVVVHTDHLDTPGKPFTDIEQIRFDEESMRVIWDTDRDPGDTPKAVSIIDKSGKYETIPMDFFLGETCEISVIGHFAKIYLALS